MTSDPPKSCLVLGSQGFLGDRVVAEFAGAGYSVIGIDRGPAAPQAEEVSPHRHVQMELPSSDLALLLDEVRPDVIVNAAGPASVAGSLSDPQADFLGTVGLLLGLLDAVRSAGTMSRVVTMSSAAVYGNPDSLPVREDAVLCPVSPYGFHKAMAETTLREYSSFFGVPTAALRVFSAYGAGLRRQILWDVCEKAAAGPVVRLFGTGEESRDFVHSSDVARAARIVAEEADLAGEAYNVATGCETSIRSLAEQLVSIVRPDATIEFSGMERAGDPSRWVADIGRIARLGFEPRMRLDQGIAEYCSWYRKVTGGAE